MLGLPGIQNCLQGYLWITRGGGSLSQSACSATNFDHDQGHQGPEVQQPQQSVTSQPSQDLLKDVQSETETESVQSHAASKTQSEHHGLT